MSHLEVWLLEDAGQLGRAVIFHLQTVDVPQDLCHQLHIVVLHRLQLHFLQLLMSLGEKEILWDVSRVLLSYDSVCYVGISFY